MRTVLALRLRQQGYAVTECQDGTELIAQLSGYIGDASSEKPARKFDLLISDIRMPGVFGTSVVEGAAENKNFPPTILITAFGDEETHEHPPLWRGGCSRQAFRHQRAAGQGP